MLQKECFSFNKYHYLCICDNCNFEFDTFNKKRTKTCLMCSFKHINLNDEKSKKILKNLWKF